MTTSVVWVVFEDHVALHATRESRCSKSASATDFAMSTGVALVPRSIRLSAEFSQKSELDNGVASPQGRSTSVR